MQKKDEMMQILKQIFFMNSILNGVIRCVLFLISKKEPKAYISFTHTNTQTNAHYIHSSPIHVFSIKWPAMWERNANKMLSLLDLT